MVPNEDFNAVFIEIRSGFHSVIEPFHGNRSFGELMIDIVAYDQQVHRLQASAREDVSQFRQIMRGFDITDENEVINGSRRADRNRRVWFFIVTSRQNEYEHEHGMKRLHDVLLDFGKI